MKLDTAFLFALSMVFVRISSMLLVSPIFGTSTPTQIRIGLCGAITFALTPILQPYIGAPPETLSGLLMATLQETLIGLLIGTFLQALLIAAQMAGSLVDLQLGLASVQLFNPMTSSQVSLVAQFKYFLALVLLLLMNGHHLMFQAFVASYQMTQQFSMESAPLIKTHFLSMLSQTGLLALQIAAPAAAVCTIIDAAAGIVNKSVPQMQVYFVSMPAKLIVGIIALGFALPIMVVAVQSGLEHTFSLLGRMLRG